LLERIRGGLRSFVVRAALNLQNPLSYAGSWTGGWWWPHETGTGTWQTNTATADPTSTLLTFPPIFACITGIAQDIGKLRIKLDRITVDGIWAEITQSHGNSEASSFLAVLNKPNHFQTRIQFVKRWIGSKLIAGNTYVLKQRAPKRPGQTFGDVVAMYVLDPARVTVLFSDAGQIYYELRCDKLAQTDQASNIVRTDGELTPYSTVTVPASEIIHDMMTSLWHELIGISPLTACALSATLGGKINNHSITQFTNRALPGGILTAVGAITDEHALELKEQFETSYSGENSGKIAVLADGLTFTPLNAMTNDQAQLAEQLKMTREDVAMVFHYPLYKLGLAQPPYANGPQSAQLLYYTDCLQPLIEEMEACLNEGLGLPSDMSTELDIDGLLRMDTVSLYESIDKMGKWATPNEQRNRGNYPTVGPAGDTIYRQEQDHSIEAVYKRDQQDDPFGKKASTPAPQQQLAAAAPPENRSLELTDDEIRSFDDMLEEELALV
jgi:HK97 family phage portal protein